MGKRRNAALHSSVRKRGIVLLFQEKNGYESLDGESGNSCRVLEKKEAARDTAGGGSTRAWGRGREKKNRLNYHGV